MCVTVDHPVTDRFRDKKGTFHVVQPPTRTDLVVTATGNGKRAWVQYDAAPRLFI